MNREMFTCIALHGNDFVGAELNYKVTDFYALRTMWEHRFAVVIHFAILVNWRWRDGQIAECPRTGVKSENPR
jgi:hypothetical protein